MLNILITGANGQLGNEMRLLGAKSQNRYFFTDVADLDITDGSAVRHMVASEQIDVIVNCAAYTNVEKAEDDHHTADLINHEAVKNLATAANETGATLIHISTDYVFNGDNNLPYSEIAPTNPLGVYGRTKLTGEQAIEMSGCNYLIFRTAWLYSTFGNNFVKTMLRLTSEREQVNVVFDQVGSPTYAADLASVLFNIVEQGNYTKHKGIYHYTNEGLCSWYDFAHEIAQIANHTHCEVLPCRSSEFPTKVARPAFSVLDKSKIKNTFGITIPHWRESLVRCINELKTN